MPSFPLGSKPSTPCAVQLSSANLTIFYTGLAEDPDVEIQCAKQSLGEGEGG
jgi:hypothetical protein